MKNWCIYILLVLFTVGCGGAVVESEVLNRTEIIDSAKVLDVAASTLDGAAWSSDTLTGKPTLIMMFTSWCKPCFFALRQMNTLRQDPSLKERFNVVGVLLDEGQRKEVMEDLLTGEPIGFPIVVGTPSLRAQLRAAFKVSGVPASCILDSNRQVVEIFEGNSPVSYLARRAIRNSKERK